MEVVDHPLLGGGEVAEPVREGVAVEAVLSAHQPLPLGGGKVPEAAGEGVPVEAGGAHVHHALLVDGDALVDGDPLVDGYPLAVGRPVGVEELGGGGGGPLGRVEVPEAVAEGVGVEAVGGHLRAALGHQGGGLWRVW